MIKYKRDRYFLTLAFLFVLGGSLGYLLRNETLLNCLIMCALLGGSAWCFISPWVDRGIDDSERESKRDES